MEQEFRISKTCRLGSLAFQLMIFISSLIPAITTGAWIRYYGIAVVLASAGTLWLKSTQQDRYERGEEYRRLLFFTKSLDVPLLPQQLAEIEILIRAKPDDAIRRESEYYDSVAAPGKMRTLENLQESSYYTHKLAGKTKAAFRTVSFLGLVVAVVFMLSTLNSADRLTDPSALRRVAEITSKLLAFLAVGQYVELWFSFSALERTTRGVYNDICHVIQQPNVDEKFISRILSTYDCALAAASPIPTWVWKTSGSKLNRGWDKIKCSRVCE